MANNQYINKVIYGDQTLIDLTQDTITADKLLAGYTAHNSTGATVNGTIAEKTSDDIIQLWNNDGAFSIGIPKGYYNYNYMKIMTPIFVTPPEEGSHGLIVCVPNGTLTPNQNNQDDWIPITIEVDENGNSNITDNTIPASGVSF